MPNEPFQSWLSLERPNLVRMAQRVLKDRHQAEDLVQAILLKLWTDGKEREVRSLEAYARRAVWLNALRLRGRQRDLLPVNDQWVAPEPLFRELSARDLERGIASLPPAQQSVIRLRFYAGLSFKEIGRSLEISLHTAASRCRYALGALRRMLNANNPGEKR